MRPHERIAVPSAWETHALPVRRASVTLDRVFSPQDMDRIRRGVVPEGMCCNLQKATRARLVESTRLRLMPPLRTACG